MNVDVSFDALHEARIGGASPSVTDTEPLNKYQVRSASARRLIVVLVVSPVLQPRRKGHMVHVGHASYQGFGRGHGLCVHIYLPHSSLQEPEPEREIEYC